MKAFKLDHLRTRQNIHFRGCFFGLQGLFMKEYEDFKPLAMLGIEGIPVYKGFTG